MYVTTLLLSEISSDFLNRHLQAWDQGEKQVSILSQPSQMFLRQALLTVRTLSDLLRPKINYSDSIRFFQIVTIKN